MIIAFALGAASALLLILSVRVRLPWLGWLMLAPLAAALYLFSPLVAALAGLSAGALYAGTSIRQMDLPGSITVISSGVTAVWWALVSALAALLWPDGVPGWGSAVVPVAALVLTAMPRFAALPGYASTGAARFFDPFLRSQGESLRIVHIARLGSDLLIAPLLALASTVPVIVLVELPPTGATAVVAVASLLVVSGALAFGSVSYRRTIGRVEAEQSFRVAAVSADAQFDGYARSPAYLDIDATIRRYEPQVTRVTAERPRLIVLPEHAVFVTAQTRGRWLETVSCWAKHANARVVTGLFDVEREQGQLVIVDENGDVAATYEKQHPMMGLEPKRKVRMPPAVSARDPFPVSAVICFDLDFNDLIRPVARRGGVLAVSANDWKGTVEQLHHESSAWAAVMAGVPLVRSTGHGISSVYDAAGRVLAQANSFDGPVGLVADVPIQTR